jgi:DNA polymerase-3 subunit delta'
VVDGRIKSPLLLVGPEGTGRKSSVKAAIRDILVVDRGESSPEVAQYDLGVHPDVFTVEPEADKDLGVDAIREVVGNALQYPVASPCRFFIVDGADRMTGASANAILKTLEESPDFVRFFLLAESYDRVIPTIRSRCGRVDYKRLPESFILSRLSKFEKDPNKALVYARLGEGSIGKATRYWTSNQILVRDKVTELVTQGASGDIPTAYVTVDGLGKNLNFALKCLVSLVHDVLVVSSVPDRVINQDMLDDLRVIQRKTSLQKWSDLWLALKVVWYRNETHHVNLPLQIKSAFASVFAG